MGKTIVILTGPRQSYGFCPLPPLTDSAPERNLFRLTEYDYGEDLQIDVISACSQSQLTHLQVKKYIGKYHWIGFPDSTAKYSQTKILNNWLVNGTSNRIFHTPDLLSYSYLRQVYNVIKTISPDLILINSLPQYIRFIHEKFPETKLGLFVRGEMGDSRNYLPVLDLIITNSDGISNYVKTLLNGAAVRIEKIPNTLESNYCIKEKIYSSNPRRIIYTGRIEPVKGILELIRAFSLVQEKFSDVHLSIIGGNFRNKKLTVYEQAIKQEAIIKNLNIEFIGQMPNQELPHLYQEADIAVFPSLCLESFGMVALEAMRCGLPVVATRRPGFEELIIEEETGLIVDDPADIHRLAAPIIELLNHPQKIISMGKRGYTESLRYLPDLACEKFQKLLINIK